VHDWVLWVLVAASALHVVEEHALGWQGWAAVTLAPRLGVTPTWMDFWPTNGFLIVFGVAAAAVGWRAPGFSLALPAGVLVNTVFFHVLPTVSARRPNPGVFTAVALYIPIAGWAYRAAVQDGVLSAGTVILSVCLGALAMASVIAILVLRKHFRYPDVSPHHAEVRASEVSVEDSP
jgi:Protein of unknown function with HXXEE motif